MALEAATAAQYDKHHMHPYAYQVTRATLIHQPTTTILYTIQSCAVSIFIDGWIGLLKG